MKYLSEIFEANQKWAERMEKANPGFFSRMSESQKPQYLWIGCADSRVPANDVCGCDPGELFVHRNVANLVVHTDFNCLSVIQYAVEALQVSHIMVCGHYGCGGVRTAMEHKRLGLIDNWLLHIRDVYARHRDELEQIADPEQRHNRLCELNVAAQFANVCYTDIVQKAWERGQKLTVHGWIFDMGDGRLKDLGLSVSGIDGIPPAYRVE